VHEILKLPCRAELIALQSYFFFKKVFFKVISYCLPGSGTRVLSSRGEMGKRGEQI
jgi:hypothetical protein